MPAPEAIERIEILVVSIPRDVPYLGAPAAGETINPSGYFVRGGNRTVYSTMDRSDHSNRAFGIRDGAVCSQCDIPAGALESSPEIRLEARMLGDGLHRCRMERLQQKRTDRANEHRGIAMHAPDRIVFAEPTLAVARNLAMLGLEVASNAFPNCSGQAHAWIDQSRDRHVAERTPDRKGCSATALQDSL